MAQDQPTKIPKSKIEYYEIGWDSYLDRQYLCVKVVRKVKGKIKHKNMITLPAIEISVSNANKKKQLAQAKKTWGEIKKAVDEALKDVPEKKIEF